MQQYSVEQNSLWWLEFVFVLAGVIGVVGIEQETVFEQLKQPEGQLIVAIGSAGKHPHVPKVHCIK